MFCREQAAQFTEVADAIAAKGAELVFLGNGESFWAGGFRDRYAPGQRVLSDPKRGAYRAMGMTKGVRKALNTTSGRHALRATAKGFVQGITRGTSFQNGGVLVLAPGNQLLYAYKSEVSGDHPDPAEAIAALDG